jgi:nucleoside transporter
LSNSLCFRWLPNPAVQFPRIRAIGTIGWIASGLIVGAIAGAAESRLPLLIGATLGVFLTGYSLTLPATPPCREQIGRGIVATLGLDVIAKQGTRNFWVVIVATFLIMLPMAFYYAYCNNFLIEAGAVFHIGGLRLEATALQAMGQMSELLFLLLLPGFLTRFGIKGVFMLGIVSWVLRYTLFALAYDGTASVLWMLAAGVLLHGAANDFVQVAGQIYVNQCFDETARSRAQAFLTTVLMGIGTIAGSLVANLVYDAFTTSPTQHDWPMIWALPASAALATLGWFAWCFRPKDTMKAKPA